VVGDTPRCAGLLSDPTTAETEAVKAELQRRRQEYRDHPERFEQLNDGALDQMFRDIENEKPQPLARMSLR
jgi:hypothetical protein